MIIKTATAHVGGTYTVDLKREVLPGRVGDLPVRLVRERLAIRDGERTPSEVIDRSHTELILGGLTVEGSLSSADKPGIDIDCKEIPGSTSLHFPAKEPRQAVALASAFDASGAVILDTLQCLLRAGSLGQPSNLYDVLCELDGKFIPDK